MVERGVILAGGEGTRMRLLSNGGNKHLIPVAGRLMIEYPLQMLQDLGIEKTTIVSTPSGVEDIARAVNSELDIEYRVQPKALGMAHALGCAAVKEKVFMVLCGDCVHDPAPHLDGSVQLWWTRQDGLNGGAVWDARNNRIVEKPPAGLSPNLITGMRVYDSVALELLDGLKPSSRGELELADIDNYYLTNGLEMSYYGGFFGDMGTAAGLARVERHINDNRLPS